jgi:hypothetical protein
MPLPDKTVNLASGQAAFLSVSAAQLGVLSGQRVEVHPIVTVTPNTGSVCLANVEVFDSNNGRTAAWMPSGPPL